MLPGVSSVIRAIACLVVGILKGMSRVGINHDLDFFALLFQSLLKFFDVVDGDAAVLPAEDAQYCGVDLV